MPNPDSMNKAIRIAQMAFHDTEPDAKFDEELGEILMRMGPEGADLLAAMTALVIFAFTMLPEPLREKIFSKPVDDEFQAIIEDFNA